MYVNEKLSVTRHEKLAMAAKFAEMTVNKSGCSTDEDNVGIGVVYDTDYILDLLTL